MIPFLSIQNLTIHLVTGPVILRSISLDVAVGQVHALVGESGAGKSMIGKAVLGILPRAMRITAGKIMLDGVDLLTLSSKERRRIIGTKAALIPQDPLTALNPSKRIGPQITKRLVDILGWVRSDANNRARALLEEVHIADVDRVMRSYPHELSGGMRQRILIASAFAAEPMLIIADEPTTALDVTVQKQILKLMAQMQRRHGTALLFVTHDLGVVSKTCDTLSVLYAGKIVEEAQMRRFFTRPIHAYSRALLVATPTLIDPAATLIPVSSDIIAAVEQEVLEHDLRHSQ